MTATLDEIKEILLLMNKNIEAIHEKVTIICNKLDGEIFNECKKMSSHIDFVENVYNNMKHPLNYICDTITSMSDNKTICNDVQA